MKPWNKIHLKQIDKGICPRCEGLIPANTNHGEYMGITSRFTQRQDSHKLIEVCLSCGTEEALQEHLEGFVSPAQDWPVMTSDAVLRRAEAFEILLEIEENL